MKRPTDGFTLLEVLAAVAILGIWFVVLASVGIQGLRAEGTNERRIRASLLADTILSEDLSVRRARFNTAIPYYAQVAWNRDEIAGADGTLTLRLGAVSVSVVLVAQVGWQVLRIPLGVGNWFRNFNEDVFTVELELAGNTVGELLLDDVIIWAMTPFAGEWYAPVGGRTRWLAPSPAPAPRQGDLFTWADTETGAKIQRWTRIGFPGLWLPHATGGSVTLADP